MTLAGRTQDDAARADTSGAPAHTTPPAETRNEPRASWRLPVDPETATRVEQAIARGHTLERIAATLELPIEHVERVWRRMDSRASEEPPALEPCGTNAAYCRHVSRGEPIDQACRDARHLYELAHRPGRYGTGAVGV